MTDKQIIIDGVDVSGCPYYIHKDGSCSSHDYECVKCVHNVCFYKDYKVKEQECERLNEHSVGFARKCQKLELDVCHLKDKNYNLQRQLDQLKAEVKSKTEYIQEQREIINQYSKEIEMYKKCQGKRASKREEELEAENERLDNEAQNLFTEKTNLEIEIKELKAENERLRKEIRLYDCIDKWGTEQCRCACRCLGNEFCNDADKKINKLKQAIEKIKEIAETCSFTDNNETLLSRVEQILQICDEVNE